MKRLKSSQLPAVRNHLLVKQEHLCPLCLKSMKGTKGKKPALDHDHRTGYIRDVLCLNCNGMEGKIFNLATRCVGKDNVLSFLRRLVEYLERHVEPKHGRYLHPTHKTEQEKRLARNAKARKKRAQLKGK
jgi:hypothetical protein